MRGLYKHPWAVVAVIACVTVFFALQLPGVRIENGTFRFVPKDDPAKLQSNRIDDVFGSQNKILIGFERRYGTVLEAEFLARLKEYVEKAEAVPLIEEVTSLINADYIDGSSDEVAVVPLVPEGFSGSAGELAALKERLLGWDLYRKTIISDDFAATQVIVSLGSGPDNASSKESVAAYKELRRMAEEGGFPDTNLYFAGMTVLSASSSAAMKADISCLLPLVLVVVTMVLFLSFRRLGGVLLPLLSVSVSTIWSLGAMPLFDTPLSIITTVLPIILIAVGSAYGVHIVSHYYDEAASRPGMSRAERGELIRSVMGNIGWPLFLAALTTAAGFISFCFTSVVPIREFGIFSGFGVAAAYLISVTLVPSLLAIRGPVRRSGDRGLHRIPSAPPPEDRLSSAIADAFSRATKRRGTVVAAACAVLLVSCFGVSRLVIDNVMVEYFKDDTDPVRADGFIRERFGGSKSLSVVVSSPVGGGVLGPDVLGAMDGLSAFIEKDVPEVGKVTSFTDLVKRVNQVLNADADPEGLAPTVATPGGGTGGGGDEFGFGFQALGAAASSESPPSLSMDGVRPSGSASPLDAAAAGKLLESALSSLEGRGAGATELAEGFFKAINYRGAAYHEVPTDPARYGKAGPDGLRALVSNYLVLLSGDIGSYANDPLEPTSIRMNLQLRTVGQRDTDRAVAAIERYVADRFPKDVSVEIGGKVAVEKSLNLRIVQAQLVSVGTSLLFVFIILGFFYRSLVAGALALIPLSLSIVANFAVMGFAGIKLNIGTAMVASISVGIGIDYTIHYIASFAREFERGEGRDGFLRRTFLSSGKAIIFNAVSVGLGFAVLAFSRFNILADLGILVALTMGTSSLVSLTLLPVLLDVLRPAFVRRLPSREDQDEGGELLEAQE